jgi:hypothetical protein
MEGDFGLFLNVIEQFQKSVLKNTHVDFLGDMYELWETVSVVGCFTDAEEVKRFYKALDDLAQWLYNELKQKQPTDVRGRQLKKYLEKLITDKMSASPIDAQVKKQVDQLYSNRSADNFLVTAQDSKDKVEEKAKYMKRLILGKHHGRDGRSLEELFDAIHSKLFLYGNHDNYVVGLNECNSTFCLWGWEVEPWRFSFNLGSTNSSWMLAHGHNLDKFNNDGAAGVGRMITGILVLYELKKRGDLIRDFEALFRSDAEVRLDHLKQIARLCYGHEKRFPAERRKHKLFVFAHTHQPYFKNMTNEYRIWGGMADLLQQGSKPQLEKRNF